MQGEAIYKGATRPAMKLGIPLVPLVVLFGTGGVDIELMKDVALAGAPLDEAEASPSTRRRSSCAPHRRR